MWPRDVKTRNSVCFCAGRRLRMRLYSISSAMQPSGAAVSSARVQFCGLGLRSLPQISLGLAKFPVLYGFDVVMYLITLII